MALRRRCSHLLALACLLVAVGLHTSSVLNPTWATTERVRLSLWETCEQMERGWVCSSTKTAGREWQLFTLTHTLCSFGINLIALFIALLLFIYGSYRHVLRVVALLLLFAVALQVHTLLRYTKNLIDDGIIRTYQQLDSGYKLAWTSIIFNFFGAILYCLP